MQRTAKVRPHFSFCNEFCFSLKVSYFDGYCAELGNTIEPKDLRYQPHWVRWTGDKDSYYTFMMIGTKILSKTSDEYDSSKFSA